MLATLNLGVVSAQAGGFQQFPIVQQKRHSFCDMERTSGFILDQNALTFVTTEYDIFQKFSRQFVDGLDVVHDIVSLNYIDRIGLRYLDAVFPTQGKTLSDYLNHSVVSLAEKTKGNLVHYFSETNLRFEDTNVVVRVISQDGRVGFPPDLTPSVLNVAERFQAPSGRHAVLDTDGWYEGREIFDRGRLVERLEIIHENIKGAFLATITPYALKAWE